MKNVLKRISILLVIVLSLGVPMSVYAKDEITVVLNGEQLHFDVPPQIINNRTMVPMRVIFEALGAEVTWDAKTQTVTAIKDGTIIKTTINSKEMYINGTKNTMDVAPVVVENRTLVPVRFVSEALDCEVIWDGSTWTVYILTAEPDSMQSQIQENNGPSTDKTDTLGSYIEGETVS